MGTFDPYSPPMSFVDQILKAAKTLNQQPVRPQQFNPDIWSEATLKAFRDSMKMVRRVLEPRDVWAPTGETFEEAVAWARLCGVAIYTSDVPTRVLFLHKPGCITTELDLCSPTELIDAIRDYAQKAKSPQADDE